MLRPRIREFFRLRPRGAREVGAEVDEEIAHHLELRVQELVAEGYDEATARIEAERRFGDRSRARERLLRSALEREYRMNLREWLSGCGQDLRYSARSLAGEPLVALVVVLTLALGIGANATMFGIIDRLLLRGPAHVARAEELGRVYVTQEQWGGVVKTSAGLGYVTYALLRDGARTIAGAAAYHHGSARIGRGASTREIVLGRSTWDFFPLLSVEPVLGRFYGAGEDHPPQGERVAVLEYGYWQAEFGGSRDVLGSTITIDDEPYVIIGIAPQGFTGAELEPVAVWTPISVGWLPHPDEWPTTWNARWLSVVVRLQPGTARERFNAEATALFRAAAPGDRPREAKADVSVLPLHYGPAGEEPTEVSVTRWLAGVSAVVLLIACANTANLLLARVVRRRREVAVRLALGVSRHRLLRLLFAESLLLAAGGGLAALALAYWGGDVLRVTLLPDVAWGDLLDVRVLGFSALCVLLTTLMIGVAPALAAGRQHVTALLRGGARDGGARRSGLLGLLTVLQAALSLVLLIGAGLFVKSLWQAQRVELGIDADRVLAVWMSWPGEPGSSAAEERAEAARQRRFQAHAAELLGAAPEVEATAVAMGTPLQGLFGVDLFVPGHDSLPSLPGGGPFIVAVSPGYFETVGTRTLRGRGIERGEGAGTERVVVVNETMARVLWPGEDALTKCIVIAEKTEPCARVVGVAEDVKPTGIHAEPSLQYYIPLGQEKGIAGTQLLVRPRGAAAAYVAELRRRLFALDPTASYFDIRLLQAVIDPQIRPWRLGATMFLVFGCLALVIAAVGLYSVMAYGVTQRRPELGVRIALGARGGEIVALVLRQSLTLVLGGLILGLLLALAAGRHIERLLFATSARDLPTFATVTAVLFLAALAASIIPARRASATSPLEALRAD